MRCFIGLALNSPNKLFLQALSAQLEKVTSLMVKTRGQIFFEQAVKEFVLLDSLRKDSQIIYRIVEKLTLKT